MTIEEAFMKYFKEKGQFLTKPEQLISRLIKIKNALPVSYLDEIDEVVITNFKNQYIGKMSNATINRYLYHISTVLNTAKNEWKIKTTPLIMKKFKLTEPDENVKYIKDWDTLQRIIDKAAPHLKPIIYTGIYSTLRRGNILSLKWENIDFALKNIHTKVKDKTKQNGKNHSVPIVPKLLTVLENQPHINEYVFNYKGKPIKSISSSWRNIFYKRDKSGRFTKELKDETLPYINFHTLRHTAATWILRKTKDLRVTKEILGHADIKTTLKYAHILDDAKREALNSVFSV
ncbi:MAG: site-specific integrase [Alphaproteobacteria bacterium]|nr:site-specific integrase [Alphaproteobacteria bacterium]